MCVCVCVCVCVINSFYGLGYFSVDTVFGFYRYYFFMLSWMFQHDYFDTCCFEFLICICLVNFVFAPVQHS